MDVDHLSFAAQPDGLRATADRLGELLGTESVDGGTHPRFGTRNRLVPLADHHYIEVVEVLDHPAADKVSFGQVVRARSEAGGGWLGWVLRVSDIAPWESHFARPATDAARRFPDGRLLEWKQIAVSSMLNDSQRPYVLQWLSAHELRPGTLDGSARFCRFELSGSRERVADHLGVDAATLDDLPIDWVAPNGEPGMVAAHFCVGDRDVRI